MQTKTKLDVERINGEINKAIAKLSIDEAMDAVEEIGSHADAVLDGLRDDKKRQDGDL